MWQELIRSLAALIKVKTIVTLVVIGVFAALALSGALQPDTVMTVVSRSEEHTSELQSR